MIPAADPPTVSVVVPTYNRCQDLRVTIEHLCAQTYPAQRIEILVVDNASTDGTEALVASLQGTLGERLRYVRKDPNGPAAARNLGARLARGAFVAFVDSDVALEPGWLDTTVAALRQDASIGMVGGRLVYAHAPDVLNAYGGALSAIGLAWDSLEGQPAALAAAPRDTLWISCSAVLLRRALLDEGIAFDERYFYGYEDTDFGWRINLAGHRVVVVPGAVAHHRVGAVIGRGSEVIAFHAGKNRLRSLLKNLSAPRLALRLPGYLAYAVADAALRAPRRPKAAALLWNLRMLPDTLQARAAVQRGRRRPDRALSHLMETRWFPPVPLAGRRRRPIPGHRESLHIQDDRVG